MLQAVAVLPAQLKSDSVLCLIGVLFPPNHLLQASLDLGLSM
jgi:hypothetical protein